MNQDQKNKDLNQIDADIKKLRKNVNYLKDSIKILIKEKETLVQKTFGLSYNELIQKLNEDPNN